jgi:Lon protease-like protein
MSGTELPQRIPVFPLSGALVYPRGRLPLHIFEPRYRAMIKDAMAGDGMIGMIQPREHGHFHPIKGPALFDVGGLGKISQCTETNDGRYLISLEGVSRFRVARELDVVTPYRQVEADYSAFARDQLPASPLMPAMRAALESELTSYLDRSSLSADWEAVVDSDDEALVNTLACACPFTSAEKQVLLEAGELAERAQLLLQIMQFATGTTDPESKETLQ